MPRRKIAFIHPDLGIGGAERLVLDVASALSKQGNDVFFITNHFDKNHCFEELKKGEFQVQVYGDWLPRGIFGRFQALCAYIRMIYLTVIYCLLHRKTDKPDVFFVDLIPVAVPILKLFNEKVIYYCHHPDLLASTPGGTLKKLYRKPIDWVEMKSTKLSDAILVNSQYTASVFRETFQEIQNPIQVVYPTVALSFVETVKKMKTPRKIPELVDTIPTDSFVFLSINRFHPAKKLNLAISAMDHLRSLMSPQEYKKIYLIMIGGYDPQSKINATCFNQLTQQSKQLKLENKIVFIQSPSDNLKAELLLSSDCLIYTPVKEHFGIVPLEAMTVSKPVLACNSGGPRETVDHGNTGYLCEPTTESMAEFMLRLFNSDAKKLGEKGRKVLEEKFSFDSFANSLKKIVDSIDKKKL